MSDAKDLGEFRSEMVVLLRGALEVILGYLPDLHCPPLDARGAPASCIKLTNHLKAHIIYYLTISNSALIHLQL